MGGSPFSIETLVNIIWASIQPYFPEFRNFAAALVGLFLAIELIKEALNISTGRGFALDKRLLTYATVSVFILAWPQLSQSIFDIAKNVGTQLFTNANQVLSKMGDAYEMTRQVDQAAQQEMSIYERLIAAITAIPAVITTTIMSGIGTIIIIFSLLFIIILIAGSYGALALILLVGPVFIAMFLSSDLKSIGVKYFAVIVSYFVKIPLYAVVFSMAINILAAGVVNPTNLQGSVSIDHLFITIIGPLICIGLVFQVDKVVGAISGSAGSAGDFFAGGASVLGARAVVNAVKGGGGSASGGASGGGVAGSSGGGSASGGASPAVRAAIKK